MSAAQPAPDRRAVIAGSLGLAAAVAATAAPAVAASSCEARALLLQVDQVAARYQQAKDAYAAAVVAHEADLPRLHPSLDFTDLGGMAVGIPAEHGHLNAYVLRGKGKHGPRPRYIATAKVIQARIDKRAADGLGRSRFMHRLLRRATKYEAALHASQQRHRLDDLHRAQIIAWSELTHLAAEVFEKPARTQAMMAVQARVICILGGCDYAEMFNKDWLLGTYGLTLAQAIQAGAA